MTTEAAKMTAVMFALGAAACIAGSLCHSTAAVVLGCAAGGTSVLAWLATVLGGT